MILVTRSEWGARAPRQIARGTMSHKTSGHWNGPVVKVFGKLTWEHKYCAGLVRGIQNFHMDSRGWSDIAYNFLECPHGYTFEGRGLNVWNGANGTNTGNRNAHAICCLAGQGNPHPMPEKIGFKEAVKYIADNTSAPNIANGHRDHKSTECPGNERYNWIHNGMPVTGSTPTPTPSPTPIEEEDDIMNHSEQNPVQIIKSEATGHWYVTDGITKQYLKNRTHAAILVLNFGASTQTKPANLSDTELNKMSPWPWPQTVVDSIRLVGSPPPS